jgi:uncharacterized membrane protein YdjX (TVP38/TMEM64 family)
MKSWHPVSWIAFIIATTICSIALLMAVEVVLNDGNDAAHSTLDNTLKGMTPLLAMFFGVMVKALAEKMTSEKEK